MRARNRSVAWWVTPVVALLLLLVAGASGLTPVLHGDTIYLKNGSSIDGTVRGTHDGMVILRIGNVGRIEIAETEIENIERNDRTGYVDPGRAKGQLGKEPIIGPADSDPAEESGDGGDEKDGAEAGDGSGDEPVDEELEKEIERRLASGNYASVDDLFREALKALDDAKENTPALLERELLRGLEGDDKEMSATDWDNIEREALQILDSKKAQ